MIEYDYFVLENGLRVYVVPDPKVSVAVINILYDVGSRDETPEKTGFAHLFEHLMFGGSVNIPSYDEPLQRVGGENNAYTTTDYTNYYLTVPYLNIETGFWLESDRMLSLSFDPNVLEVQRKVVIEEFRQRYLNRPYGDVMHYLRELVYKDHPYKWPVIGKDISHIENATMDDVRDFFKTHYLPDRAIMVVGGRVTTEQVKNLSEKWFAPIPGGNTYQRNYKMESAPLEKKTMLIKKDVPQDLLLKAWPMGGRADQDYLATDLLSDVLGRGNSSRLHEVLVKDKMLCTNISCSISGSMDPGLIIVQAYLSDGVTFEQVENEIDEVINNFKIKGISDMELEKVKNQAVVTQRFGKMDILEKCTQLAYFAALDKPEWLNEETKMIEDIDKDEIAIVAEKYLKEEKSSVLYYSK